MQCVHLYMCRHMCVRYMHLLDKSRIAYRLIPLRNFATRTLHFHIFIFIAPLSGILWQRVSTSCAAYASVIHWPYLRTSKSHRRKGGEDPFVKPRNRFRITRRESQYPCKSKMEQYRVSRRESDNLSPQL